MVVMEIRGQQMFDTVVGKFRALDRGRIEAQRDGEYGVSAGFQNTVQFGKCGLVVRYMFKNIGGCTEIKGTVGESQVLNILAQYSL